MNLGIYDWLVAASPLSGSFATHAFACVVSARWSEEGSRLNQKVGLPPDAWARLLVKYFPHAVTFSSDSASLGEADDGVFAMEERNDLVRLLLGHRSLGVEEEEWAAWMVAGACARPDHLWQDLGLRDRSDVSALMETFFQPLAARNVRNMKWKKFLYREMCAAEGGFVCTSPICDVCVDYFRCFGPEEAAVPHPARRTTLEVRP